MPRRPSSIVRSACCGCGAVFPTVPGPTHAYMTSSPACWAAYGIVLAREYTDAAYAKRHRLSVDAYAAQHPGTPSRQTIRSIAVHLCRLCLLLENGLATERANDAMLAIDRQEAYFRWLEPPPNLGTITVKDVLAARSAEEHIRAVEQWAAAVWSAWTPHHPVIRGWLPPLDATLRHPAPAAQPRT